MADNIFESTKYELLSVTVINSVGNAIDVKYIIQDLNIYEDIFNVVASGDIILKDTHNLINEFHFCGNEYLYVKFSSAETEEYEKFFRIYKVSTLEMSTLNSMTYKLHFCSEEFVLNQQARISRSYKGKKNNEIVLDILENYLQVNPKKIGTIEETVKSQNLIIPNLKPFEAINMICSFSINNDFTSAFLFFEAGAGFNFVSLGSLASGTPYKQLYIRPQNVLESGEEVAENRQTVTRFEIEQTHDVLETLSTGGFSSTLIKMDLLHQQKEYIRFDIVNNSFPLLNTNIPINDATNRFGTTLVDPSAYIRYFPAFQGDLVDKWLLQRAAQMSLLNNFRMKVMVAGDSQMQAGMTVELDFPYFQPINTPSDVYTDYYKSGKFLVTGVRHRILDNKYFNYLELCKDSNISAVPSFNATESYSMAKTS